MLNGNLFLFLFMLGGFTGTEQYQELVSHLCLLVAGVSLSSLCCSTGAASWQTNHIFGLDQKDADREALSSHE